MAIKVNNVTVIDDSRNATVVNASANSLTYSGTNVLATAAEINQLDGVTDNVQTQIDSSAKVAGTLDRTFSSGETVSLTLSNTVSTPVVSVIKEVPQTGITNNDWDVAADGSNFTLHDTAYDTTLTPSEIGFAINSPSYDNVSFDVSGQNTGPYDIAFNNDGTKMYILGNDNDSVFQYTLSTAFDLSTTSYDSVSFDVSGQDTVPLGITFNDDGTKMYVVGANNNIVYQYILSTPFDLSTANYDLVTFDTSGQTTSPRGIEFNNDGTRMYIVGRIENSVFQYTLSTAFDLSTASYDNVSFDVSGQDESPQSIVFNTDGTKIYIFTVNKESVQQYSLTTAFDLSAASYDNISFSVAAQEGGTPIAITFNTDGTKLYTANVGSNSVFQYNTGSPGAILGFGSFASTDVGKRIVGNGGEAVLTAADGSYELQTPFNDTSTIAAGDWSMFALDMESADAGLTLSGVSLLYDIENATYNNVSFDVSGQDTGPNGIAFNNDGTKMYMVGGSNNSVFQYTLSTAFDLSTASYDSVTISTQTSTPNDITFNNDGTKMYIAGYSDDNIYQYTLSTAFDLSTASYDSVFFNTSSQSTNVRAVTFNDNGTKMYVTAAADNFILQYTLSTAFDISTVSYDNISFDISAQDFNAVGFSFNNDGTKMYIVGNSNDSIYQYALSTAFDLSTVSYESVSRYIGIEVGSPANIKFDNDGIRMYIVGSFSNSVYQYATGSFVLPTDNNHTAITSASIDSEFWADINSMTADDSVNDGAVYYAVSTDDRTTWSIIDDTNGIRNIVRNNSGTWEVNDASDYATETWVAATENDEFYALEEAVELSTAQNTIAFDLENASYDNVSFDVTGQDGWPTSITFNNDGTKMYIVGNSNDSIYQYTLSTAFDLSTISYDNVSFDVSGQEAGPIGVAFNNDGTKMYIVGNFSDSVHQYTLSTAFDLSTISYDNVSFDVSSEESSPEGIVFNNDGTKMYIVGQINESAYQYTLSTAFDLSTASYDNVSFDVSGEDTRPSGITFNTDGTKMYTVGRDNDSVYQYTLSAAFDLSTASYDSVSFSVAGQETDPYGITFNNDGTKMYIAGNAGNSVYQYTTGLITSTNRMGSTQLNAVSDANHYTLGNDLDLAITLFMADGNTSSPTSDGVAINYDTNVKNEGAVLGTDYEFDAPATDTVRIKNLSASSENYKVKVI